MKNKLYSAAAVASIFGLLVSVVSPDAQADDAKKAALARAKALAICTADYTSALAHCEQLTDAAACYVAADANDLTCREAQGTVGHSDAAIDPALFPPTRGGTTFGKLLTCTGGLLAPVVCAEGHARPATCFGTIPGVNGGSTRVEVPQNVDQHGFVDTCSGNALICPPGFAPIARLGTDLCWDSERNRDQYNY